MAKSSTISSLFKNQPDRLYKYTIGLMVILLCVIYGQTITYDYTLDDAIVISDNQYVEQGIQGIPGLWTHDTFQGFFKDDGSKNLVSGGRYRPWTPTLFILERAIFGKKAWVGHLFNLITIIGACLLLMLVLRKLTLNRFSKKQAIYFTILAGLLYAVHPVHTEAIANIKGRDEIWVLLSSLGALYLMISPNLSNILRWIGILVLSIIAMTSKENALFLLIMWPFLYGWKMKTDWKKTLKVSIPLLLGIAIALMIRASVVGVLPGEAPRELMNNPFLKWTGSGYIDFSISEKAGTILSSLLTYIRLYIFPWPLTHDYYPRQIGRIEFTHWRSILAILTYSGLAISAIFTYKKHRLYSLGIGMFFITLLPISNIFFPVGTLASERFLFIPSLGLTIALAYALSFLLYNKKKVLSIAMTGVIIIFVILSFIRTQAWQDNFTLFSTDVETSSASAKANNSMGGALIERAGKLDNEQEKKQLAAEAETYLQKAISIHPTYKNAFLLLGNSFFYRNMYENALRNYNKALSLDPDYKDGLNNKFVCLRTAGRYYGEEKNNLQKSESMLEKALQLRPRDYETLRLMGVNQGIQKKNRRAIQYFKKALNVSNRKISSIYKNIGIAYSGLGMQDSSQYYLQLAERLNSKD